MSDQGYALVWFMCIPHTWTGSFERAWTRWDGVLQDCCTTTMRERNAFKTIERQDLNINQDGTVVAANWLEHC